MNPIIIELWTLTNQTCHSVTLPTKEMCVGGGARFRVETNTSVKSEKIPPPPPDYTRVDCERPRIYAGVDPELYPRGRLWWLPESTPPSQDLPPFTVIM